MSLIDPDRGEWPDPDFQPLERLGYGHFGEVWKVLNARHFPRALKLIRLGGQASQLEMHALEMVKRIRRHPHLINVSNAWQRGGFLIIEMDLADGDLKRRLAEVVRQGLRGIPVNELLENICDAAKGLDHLNKYHHLSETGELLAVQHKDIKPANLLVMGGVVLIGDWGVAQFLDHTSGDALGGCTEAYAAPELFNGKVSRWSDQYSLALTYGHLRGGRVFSVGHECRLVDGRLTKPAHLTMMSDAEWAVVAKALDREPPNRWPDCGTFAAELAASVRAMADASTLSLPWPAAAALRLTPPPPLTLEPGLYGRSLRVEVKRGAWTGPIQLRLEDLPEGVKARPAVIAAGEEAGEVEVRADAAAAGQAGMVRLVARAGGATEQAAFLLTVLADRAAQDKATLAIRKRGGEVQLEKTRHGPSVTAVRLTGPHIKDADLAILEPLVDLRTLTIHQTRITGAGLTVLRELPRLQELHVLACTRVDREWPRDLPGLAAGLRQLSLCYTEVSDGSLEGLRGLTSLEKLDLAGTMVGDAALAHLEGLTALQELNLRATVVSDQGVDTLQAARPNLKIHWGE